MFDQWDNVRRLLVVYDEPVKTLDDLQPALRRLREALPAVHLTLLIVAELPVTEAPAGVDDLLAISHGWAGASGQAIAAIRAGHYDAALILNAPGDSPYGAAYACYLAGVPVRLGQSVEFGGAVLSHRLLPLSPAVPPPAHYLHLVSQVVC